MIISSFATMTRLCPSHTDLSPGTGWKMPHGWGGVKISLSGSSHRVQTFSGNISSSRAGSDEFQYSSSVISIKDSSACPGSLNPGSWQAGRPPEPWLSLSLPLSLPPIPVWLQGSSSCPRAASLSEEHSLTLSAWTPLQWLLNLPVPWLCCLLLC